MGIRNKEKLQYVPFEPTSLSSQTGSGILISSTNGTVNATIPDSYWNGHKNGLLIIWFDSSWLED